MSWLCPICGVNARNPIEAQLPDADGVTRQHRCKRNILRQIDEQEGDYDDSEPEPTYDDMLDEGFRMMKD